MKLVDLDPRWFTVAHLADGVIFHIGLTFLCPHCMTQRLAVQFDPPIDPQGLIAKGIVWPKAANVWKRTGDTFDTLTLTPSIDASGCNIEFGGHWHGFIRDGNAI